MDAESPPAEESDSEGDRAIGSSAEGEQGLSRRESLLLGLLESRKFTAVSREEIGRHVWPETTPDLFIVSEEIERLISGLRAHLDDDPRDPAHIITAGEYGYLLV